MKKWMTLLTMSWMLILSQVTLADKPNLVLLPMDLSDGDFQYKSTYENALVESLRNQYTVFFGPKVEQQLEKEYAKIDCSAEQCAQNLAIAFNGELVADASVHSVGDHSYLIKLKITNVLDDSIVESKTLTCRGCDQLVVVNRLQSILGTASAPISSSSVALTPTPKQVNKASGKVSNKGAMAVLIFDSVPSGAEVYINDELKGKTPYQGTTHKVGDALNIKVKEPTHSPYEFDITLEQSITQLEPVTLQAGKGSLMVLTKSFIPNAVVYVDGNPVGTAPVQLELPAKNYSVYFKAGEKESVIESVSLSTGDSKQLVLERKLSLAELKIELADILAGSFMMGSNVGYSAEKPVRRVTVPAFKIMKHEVTWAQYQPCIDAGVCGDNTSDGGDNGWGKGNRPVINVNWNDTQDYIRWLNQRTGMNFRLPSEAEWEYAARAGSTTKYSWGNFPSGLHANGNEEAGWPSDGYNKKTAPVGSFPPNNYGLYDMLGNVWELTQDCYENNYSDAPNNGTARESDNCDARVQRGGSWNTHDGYLRSTGRYPNIVKYRQDTNGFRLVHDY